MEKKFDYKIIVIIVLAIIFIALVVAYTKSGSSSRTESSVKGSHESIDTSSVEDTEDSTISDTSNTTASTTSSKLSSSGEVTSGLTEQLELHATYYFSEIYVEENTLVSEGDNILLYTNGEYLTAPYDCVIISISVPDEGEQCTSKHYIEIEATNTLEMTMSVSETNIDKVEIGQVATIEVSALGETYEGYVTNVSSTANNGYFTVTVEFENDGNVKIGMSATVSITV